ncbi:molybdate ABC transporter substrate-binding protein [Monashia sp. NPDC004114]
MRASRLAWSAAALFVVALAGCGSTSDNQGPGAGSTGAGSTAAGATATQGTTSDAMSGDITVFAAASLTESFTELGKQFEAAHPGTTVTFSFAASSALAQQINSGAPADVFASASQKNMDQVVSAGGASDAKVFAKNVMEIATPPNNPAGVMSVNDLAKSSVKTALCQPQVPCGSVAEKVFSNAKITVKPVTLEPDVKSVLSKVQLGEVDAGVVYVTDVMAAGDKVKGVEIPADVNASTSYPIAALTKSGNASVAAAFVDFVLSPAGQSVLSGAGFQGP